LGAIDISNNALNWPEDDFNTISEVKFNTSQIAHTSSSNSASLPVLPLTTSDSSACSTAPTTSSASSTLIDSDPSPATLEKSGTIVYGKRRGACSSCKGECSNYRGEGGPCDECGCFPARHIDLDKPSTGSLKKRKREVDSDNDSDDIDDAPREKRLRYTLETKYFQKLFFNCLHFLSLTELSSICGRAPVPVFVKDINSVYIYVNPTFCNFILDLTRSDQVLNQSTTQVLGRDGTEIARQEQLMITEEEENKPREYDLTIKKQNFRVMKQWSSMRDGQRVIIGAVVSAY